MAGYYVSTFFGIQGLVHGQMVSWFGDLHQYTAIFIIVPKQSAILKRNVMADSS